MKLKYLVPVLCLFVLSGCTQYPEEEQKADVIVLQVLAGQSTSDAGVEDMIDDWLEVHFPSVRFEWECVDWGERFASQALGKFASGNVPDIMIGKAQDVQNYVSTGNLKEISSACEELILEDSKDAVTVDGVVYGIPYNVWYQGVIYNKDIFEELHLEIPETLEELQEICDILKANEIVPFASHFSESWKVANMSMQYMINSIFSEDESWGDKFREGKTGFVSDSRVKECLQNNQFILENSWSDALRIDQFESDSRFTQGEAAMYLTGSWSMQFVNEYGNNIEFGIFPFPNATGDARLIREINMTFMKGGDTEYSDLIDEIFLEMLCDDELTEEILKFTQSSSVIKGISDENANRLQEAIGWYEESGRIIDATTGNSQFIWDFQNSLGQQQIEWLWGNKTLEEVLEYADKNRDSSAVMKGE